MKKRFYLKDLSLEEFNSIGKLPVDGASSEDSYYQYQIHRRYIILKERISNALCKKNKVMYDGNDDDKFEFIQLCRYHKLPKKYGFE